MSRVFRIGTDARFDADRGRILQDGESLRAQTNRDADGRMRAESCTCDATGKCVCPSQRGDAADRTDAVSEYERAIIETEQAGRNMWRTDGAYARTRPDGKVDVVYTNGDGSDAFVDDGTFEGQLVGNAQGQYNPVRGDAVDEYARAIAETEAEGRSLWK